MNLTNILFFFELYNITIGIQFIIVKMGMDMIEGNKRNEDQINGLFMINDY
jgi:hypothetical protein